MAPQQNGAQKRKRPEDAPVKDRKDSSKKTLETGNKRIKPSSDGKDGPAKKGPSKAPPVAPLEVSSLRVLEKEEASFPRGGGSILTPLEYKEATNQAVKDVLFETGTAAVYKGSKKNADNGADMLGGGDKKAIKKKRKADYEKQNKKTSAKMEEDTGPKVEGLSFKRIVPGVIVLGCVAQINSTDITLALPNNLVGYVPITSISEGLTKKIEALLADGNESDRDEKDEGLNVSEAKKSSKAEDDLTNLNKYFRVGQYLRACVVSAGEDTLDPARKNTVLNEHSKHKKRIELSLQPCMANTGVTKKELVTGCAIQASVASVEDHGLIVNLGLEDKSITGFISSKNLGDDLTLAQVQEGQVLLCTITGMSSNEKVVKLSADVGKPVGAGKAKGDLWNGGIWLDEAPTIDAFTPGTGVELLVTDVRRNGGLQGKLMGMVDAVVDFFHVQGWGEKALEDRIKIGSKINARVLFTNPNSNPRKLNLSILPHVLSLGATSKCDPTKALPISTIIDAAKIMNVDPKFGVFVDVGIDNIPGFVHISRLSDKKVEELSAIFGPYKIGSIHRTRIIGYNAVDGLFVCSMEQKILDQRYLRVEDAKAGEVVKGTIIDLLPSGSMLVTLSDGIVGYVEEMHLSDVKLKNPEKKFRKGITVTARVLINDPSRRQLRLTLKKTLVNSDAPIVTSYESAIPGMQTPGTLVFISPAGAKVKFYSDVTAWLPLREMSEAYIQDPKEHFRVGQSVNVHVLSVDVENGRMRVSCRDPKLFGETQQIALKNLKIGQVVSGTVAEKSNEDLVLELNEVGAEGLKAILVSSQIVDGSKQKAVQAFRNMRAGQVLKDMVVIKKVGSKRLIMLSMKPSLVNLAKAGKIVKGVEDVKEGDVLSGYITNITLHNLFVTFLGGATGAISKSEIPADKASLPEFGMARDQTVTATVCHVDRENGRFNLTLKPSERTRPGEKANAEKSKSDGTLIKHGTASVVGPLDDTIKSVEDIVVGKITKAKVLSVKETQINVLLAENVQGRVDVASLFDNWSDIKNKKRPLEGIKKDQILTVKIMGIHDSRNHRFLPITHKTSHTKSIFELSAKPRDLTAEGLENVLTLDKLKEGDSCIAFVNNHGEGCIWVNLSPSVRGRIKILELSDDAGALKDLNKSFPIGSAIKCGVAHVDAEKNQLDLCARVGISGKPITFETLEKGMNLPARVTKVTQRQVIVQLSEHVSGPINLTEMADDFSLASPTKFSKNEIIRVYVFDVDRQNKRIILSARPSRVLSSASPIRDPEILTLADVNVGDVRRGFVKSISDKGVFVALGANITAFVRIAEISEFFIKDWKSAVKLDQLVKGRITSIEKATGHIHMSLKTSVVEGATKPQIHLNELQVGQTVTGAIRSVADYGVFVVVDNSANVSGLCHISQISDGVVKDPKNLYSPGDQVKAKVLSIDLEKRRVSFGLKASYFEGENEDGDEEMADSEDDSEDGGVDLTAAKVVESDEEDANTDDTKPNEDSDAEMEDAPPPNTGLSTNGFDWTGSILDAHSAKSDDTDSDSDVNTTLLSDRKKKKKSLSSKIKQDLTGDLNTRPPESVSDFERLLMGNPQSGELWVRYMAFQLQLSEVDKAREVADRALKTITTDLKEKEFVWVAMMNMELEYGTEESLEEVFKRACVYNDSLEMHERLCNIYIQAGKYDKADTLYQSTLKKHGSTTPHLWTVYATFLFSPRLSSPDRARALLPRALQILPKQPEFIHRNLISKFAQLEFTRGDPERGRTIFENLTSTYPGKTDLLLVWVDMEMKLGRESGEKMGVRGLLERKLCGGGVDGKKVKPKVAKVLFKKWLEWEENWGDGKGVGMVKRKAREWAEQAGREKEKMDKEREKLIQEGTGGDGDD